MADVIAARYEPEPDKDFLIILGCGFRKDGTPSPLLRGRLDRALRFAEKQEAATGKAPIFVTSGGQGPDEVCSESACMTCWSRASRRSGSSKKTGPPTPLRT